MRDPKLPAGGSILMILSGAMVGCVAGAMALLLGYGLALATLVYFAVALCALMALAAMIPFRSWWRVVAPPAHDEKTTS